MYEGKKVRLREVRMSEAELYCGWVNDLQTARQISGGKPMPMSIEAERAWIEKAGRQSDDKNDLCVETLDGRPIGVCSYHDINWHARNCMVGWFIGEKELRGQGYGSDMIRTLLKICFECLGMHKVSLKVFAYNEGAWRLYERLGFVREGVEREQVFAMGRYWDDYRYAMLESEFRELSKNW